MSQFLSFIFCIQSINVKIGHLSEQLVNEHPVHHVISFIDKVDEEINSALVLLFCTNGILTSPMLAPNSLRTTGLILPKHWS